MGFVPSTLVSLTHGELSRLFRQHVTPKPRRTMRTVASEEARRWMREMDLGVEEGDSDDGDDEEEKGKVAFAGMKRRMASG